MTMMSYTEIARRLGVSRALVHVIARSALNKVRMSLGEAVIPEAPYMRKWYREKANRKRCGRCGAIGHNRRGCL